VRTVSLTLYATAVGWLGRWGTGKSRATGVRVLVLRFKFEFRFMFHVERKRVDRIRVLAYSRWLCNVSRGT